MADTIDEDFKAFCDELKKETPDIDTIRAGIQKYGFNNLSDSQKAMFQAAIFPAPTPSGKKEAVKLGFQNLKKISHTLKIMQQLHKEGAVSKEDVVAFLTEPQRFQDKKNPNRFRRGKSLLMVVGLNTYAAEFKDKRIKDKPTRDLLCENVSTMSEIQTTLGELDADILNEAFNVEDKNTGRVIKYSDLAKKSFMMKDNLERAERYAAQHQDEPAPVQQENAAEGEAVRFGGLPENSDTLTFSTQPENLNVGVKTPEENNEPNDEDTKEKVADWEEQGNDSKHGKHGFNWDPVSEQDLIKYLYNVWFLGSVNYIMKKVFNWVDGAIDYLSSDGGENPRKRAKARKASPDNSTAPAETPSAAQSLDLPLDPQQRKAYDDFVRQMNDTANPIIDSLTDIKKLFKNPAIIAAMGECIAANIGKEPGEWKVTDISLKKLFNPAGNKQFIKMLNQAYRANPALFKQRLKEVLSKPTLLAQCMNKNNFRMCVHLATVEYMLKHLGQSLKNNEAAAKEIRAQAMIKVFDTMETASLIMDKKVEEFKVKENKAPDAKQTVELQEKAAEEFAAHLEDICYTAGDLKFLLARKQAIKDPTQQQLLDQDINQNTAYLNKLLNKYRSPEEEQALPREAAPKSPTEKTDLVQEAQNQNAGARKEASINADFAMQSENIKSRQEQLQQQSANVQAFKQKHFGEKKAAKQSDFKSKDKGKGQR